MNELLDDNWGEEEAIVYETAGLGERFLAFFIDSVIFSGLGFIMTLGAYVFGDRVSVLLFWGIFIALMIATKKGWRGLGKRVMKLKVVSIEREPTVYWGLIVWRTILKYLFLSPIIFAILTFIATKKRKDPQQVFFHDLMSKTKVVKTEEVDPSKES
ncbi:MAG: RDD family protein [Aureispira sp.]